MGIFGWFKHLATAEASHDGDSPPPEGDHGAELGGLNFMAAIDVHMKWRGRLESYIQGSNKEDLQVDQISRDDQCQLGKWIHGIGNEQFGTLDTFAEMTAQHAHFHVCAGKVLATAKAGNKQDALHMLAHGDYLRASERIKMLLAKLYVQIAERA
jgi:hypothetical protein